MDKEVAVAKIYITWEEVVDMVDDILYKIKEARDLSNVTSNFDKVIGIERGGCIPGVMMSHQLGIPYNSLKWSTRDHVGKDNISKLLDLNEKTILLVDDINDSGETISTLTERLDTLGFSGELTICTLLSKSTSINRVDYNARELKTPNELDSWYVFPWETNTTEEA